MAPDDEGALAHEKDAPMMTLDCRDVERMASAQLGVIQVGLGISVIVGGAARFSPPTYDALLAATGGRAWPYGLAMLFVGFGLLIPLTRVNYWAHWCAVIVMNAFSGLFFVAMVNDPHAAATAWWVYFSLGTIHGFNIALMIVRRRRGLYIPSNQRDGRSGA